VRINIIFELRRLYSGNLEIFIRKDFWNFIFNSNWFKLMIFCTGEVFFWILVTIVHFCPMSWNYDFPSVLTWFWRVRHFSPLYTTGLDKELLLLPHIIRDIVRYYNNTPHSAYNNTFTPAQVQGDRELESWYIRKQQSRLHDVLKLQKIKYKKYQQGNILLTSQRFNKRRRNFDRLGIFQRYVHGNVYENPLDKDLHQTDGIIIPIYYTKYVCESFNTLANTYRKLFNR
jgi:hypothetical protein